MAQGAVEHPIGDHKPRQAENLSRMLNAPSCRSAMREGERCHQTAQPMPALFMEEQNDRDATTTQHAESDGIKQNHRGVMVKQGHQKMRQREDQGLRI